MRYIAHRGLIDGPDKSLENYPDHLRFVIHEGYDVEVDIWVKHDQLWLGHDEPQYKISKDWLKIFSNYLWVHCKNLEAMEFCFNFTNLNYFSHDNDDYVITSKGYVWAYPGKAGSSTTVLVMPEYVDGLDRVIELIKSGTVIKGVCTDYARRVRDETKHCTTW